jgi:hypothetical protein
MRISEAIRSSFSIVSLIGKIRRTEESKSPEELLDLSMDYPAILSQQISSESREVAELVKQQQLMHVHKIGIHKGGTCCVFSQVSAAGVTVPSLGFPFALLGTVYSVCLMPLFRKSIQGRHYSSCFGRVSTGL